MLERVCEMRERRWFRDVLLVVIVMNAVVMGVETSADVMAHHGRGLLVLNVLPQRLFLIEIAARVAAQWPSPLRFYRDPWKKEIERCERRLRGWT